MNSLKGSLFNKKHDSLTEKAFTQSIAISILGIVLCMVALCSVTWAWFSANVSSNANSIRSANCVVTVSVSKDNTVVDPVGGKYSLTKDTVYTVDISASGTASSAYCIISVDGVKHYTTQIPNGSSMSFSIGFSEDKDNVEIITCWGTSSLPDISRTFRGENYYYNLSIATLPPPTTQTENQENQANQENQESQENQANETGSEKQDDASTSSSEGGDSND